MVAMGIYAGLRGNAEHTNMKIDQITTKYFPPDHPLYPNYKCVVIDGFNDKTHVLDMKTGKARDMKGLMEFPVTSDGIKGDLKNDIGGTLLRLIAKLPPSSKEGDVKNRLYRRISRDGKRFLPNQALGSASVRNRIQYAYKHMGIPNWEDLTSHAMRSYFITKLSNDSRVNISETMAAARHRTAAASAIYQTRSKESSCNRLRALFNISNDPAAKTGVEVSVKVPLPVETNPVEDEKVDNDDVQMENTIYEMSEDEDEVEVVSNDIEKPYSIHTQAAVENLSRDLARREEAHTSSSVSNSGNWMWDIENLRRQPERNPIPRPTSSPRRILSRREREIHSLRQRVLRLEHEDRMDSFPFRSDEHAEEAMYREYTGERDFERERLMASRRRRSHGFRRNPYR